jgi:hypothetical protein
VDVDGRQQIRKRTFLGAKILFNDRRSVIDCLVKDMSEGGARLSLDGVAAIPEDFELSLSDGRAFRCKVRWRRINSIGVSFG